MLSWWSNFIPNPVFLELGWFKIYCYGLILAIAILVAYWLIRRKLLKAEQYLIDDLVLWLVIGGLLGARIYDVLVYWSGYDYQWFDYLAIWQGGLAIHGALIGGGLTLLVWCYLRKQSFWQWADKLVVVLPLAQAIGRWGNYFNQELFGKATNVSWKIFIEPLNRPQNYFDQNYFHPLFLYESLANTTLFIILYFLAKKVQRTGLLFSYYLFGYGMIRFFLEFWRIDEVFSFWSLRWPQWLSLLGVFGAIAYWLILILLPKFKKNV